jgi:hypothetical protein
MKINCTFLDKQDYFCYIEKVIVVLIPLIDYINS